MNKAEHLLAALAEEANEVAKDSMKALRFEPPDRDPTITNGANPTNLEKIIAELNDLEGVKELCVEYGILPANWRDEEAIIRKRLKVKKYFGYAVNVGTLQLPENEQQSTT